MQQSDLQQHLENIGLQSLEIARRLGATDAECLVVHQKSIEVRSHQGQIERHEQAESVDISWRIFRGHQQAMIGSTWQPQQNLTDLIAEGFEAAQFVPQDESGVLLDPIIPHQLSQNTLDLIDTQPVSVETLREFVVEADALARQQTSIKSCQDASASASFSQQFICNSRGFNHCHATTAFSASVITVAESDQGMERDYAYHTTTHWSDLESAEKLAYQAVANTVAHLEPKPLKTQIVPVFYHPRVGSSLIGHFLSAIQGSQIVKGTSFLRNQLEKKVFHETINIEENPFYPRGLSSRLIDSEGIQPQRRLLIDNGQLTTWLMEAKSARQLGMAPTGHAIRGLGSTPSVRTYNIALLPSATSTPELMASFPQALYVTDLYGSGVNSITGDYSRGARGYWLNNGQIVHPVNQITIAGSLTEMYQTMIAGNDWQYRYGTDVPTLCIPQMTVAGQG